MICNAQKRVRAVSRLGSFALIEMSASIGLLAILLTLSAGIWRVHGLWRADTNLAAERLRAQDLLEDLRRGQQLDPEAAQHIRQHAVIGGVQVVAVTLSDGSEMFSLAPYDGGQQP